MLTVVGLAIQSPKGRMGKIAFIHLATDGPKSVRTRRVVKPKGGTNQGIGPYSAG